MSLCNISFKGEVPKDIENREIEHFFPMNFILKSWNLDTEVINSLRLMTLQYVFLRPLTTINEEFCLLSGADSFNCTPTFATIIF